MNSPARPTAADLPPAARIEVAGLYLHVPFCFHKCHYCDFYSLVEAPGRSRQEAFTDRLIDELRWFRPRLGAELTTIFVGGGTPTLLTADRWRRLLVELARLPRAADLEFTVEANPETVDAELADTLVAGGVNRMSVGAQSFDRRHLEMLERHHDPDRVARAVMLLRAAGVGSISIDLIFGVPGQVESDWTRDLDAALALAPEHLSCYGLVYEPGTALTKKRDLGRIEPIDHDVEAAMYETTCRRLHDAGFAQYEISNWCRPGHACRHNLIYWRNESYWAVGPSGAGHVDGWRWRNVPRLGDYLESTGPAPVEDVERLDHDGRVGERFMLGLRLNEGLDADTVDALLRRGARGAQRRRVLDDALAAGRLDDSDGRLRFTDAGRMFANDVIAALL